MKHRPDSRGSPRDAQCAVGKGARRRGPGFLHRARPGEARGAQWQDYEERELKISSARFLGRTFLLPKTRSSMAPVPIIEPLGAMLARVAHADGDPRNGPILRGPLGKPLNLENLAKREIIPALAEKVHSVARLVFLAARNRPLVATLERDALAAKGLLRHANANTTLAHYIKRCRK